MPFTLKASNTKIEGMDVVPPGQYDFKLVGFKPAKSKPSTANPDGIVLLNATMIVINHSEFVNRKFFDNLSGAWTWADFSHSLGLPLDTDGTNSWLPGQWDGDPGKFKEDDPTTWVYRGPLLGRTGKVELAVDNYKGVDNNKVRRYFCAVADCAQKFPKIKHSTDLLKKG